MTLKMSSQRRTMLVGLLFSCICAKGVTADAGTLGNSAEVPTEDTNFWSRILTNDFSFPPPKIDCLVDVTVDCVTESGRPCGTIQADLGVCTGSNAELETLVYTVEISNIGTVQMDVTLADFTRNGQTSSFLTDVTPRTLQPTQSVVIELEFEVNICEATDYSSAIAVEANPPNGNVCQDMEKIDFTVLPPPTLPPTPSPVTPETEPPIPPPTPSPTFQPTPGPTLLPTFPPTTPGSTLRPTLPPTPGPTLPPTFPPTPGPTLRPSTPPIVSPTPGPTQTPTSPPTSAPTLPPSSAPFNGICNIEVTTDCVITGNSSYAGQACDVPIVGVEQCLERPTGAKMLFNGGGCEQSDNTQALQFSCEDFAGGPPVNEGDQVYITVTDIKGLGVTYFQGIVAVGEIYDLNNNGERFQADQFITISTPDQSTLLQRVQYHSSCSRNLELLNRFGASQLVEFRNDLQGVVSSFTTFSFSLDISVPIAATGEDIEITSLTAETSFAGFIDLTPQVANTPPLGPGASIVVTLEGTIDASSRMTYTILYNIEGVRVRDGATCSGTDTVSFEAGREESVPVPSPTTNAATPTSN